MPRGIPVPRCARRAASTCSSLTSPALTRSSPSISFAMRPWYHRAAAMSEPEIATIRPLAVKGVRMVWPRLVAYRLDRLAVLEGRDLLMAFSLDDEKPRVREVRALGYKPQSMRLSASRRFLLIGNESGNWYEVRDVEKLEPVARLSAPERFACAFATLADADVLVSAPRPGVLELMS